MELPLIAILLAALGLLIWRPWHRSILEVSGDNTPTINKPAPASNNAPHVNDPPDKSDGVSSPTKEQSPPADYGTFHTTIKPENWATTDSKGRLTGSYSFARPEENPGELIILTVSGQTLDTRGRPVAGCTITATFFALPANGGQSMRSQQVGHSDGAGVYRVGLICPKTPDAQLFMTLVASREHYAESVSEGFRPVAGEITDVDLTLTRPSRLMGAVVDDSGEPVIQAEVYLRRHREQRPGWPERLIDPTPSQVSVTADGRGRFAFTLSRGRYFVTAFKRGYSADVAASEVGIGEGEVHEMPQPLVVRRISELKLRIANMAADMPKLAQIEARFFDAQGKLAGKHLLQPQDAGGTFSGNLGTITPGIYRLELWEFRGPRLLEVESVEIRERAATDLGDIEIRPQ